MPKHLIKDNFYSPTHGGKTTNIVNTCKRRWN